MGVAVGGRCMVKGGEGPALYAPFSSPLGGWGCKRRRINQPAWTHTIVGCHSVAGVCVLARLVRRETEVRRLGWKRRPYVVCVYVCVCVYGHVGGVGVRWLCLPHVFV